MANIHQPITRISLIFVHSSLILYKNLEQVHTFQVKASLKLFDNSEKKVLCALYKFCTELVNNEI